jgi:hypothetical protein
MTSTAHIRSFRTANPAADERALPPAEALARLEAEGADAAALALLRAIFVPGADEG